MAFSRLAAAEAAGVTVPVISIRELLNVLLFLLFAMTVPNPGLEMVSPFPLAQLAQLLVLDMQRPEPRVNALMYADKALS